jgi:hypothetical protein
MANSLVCFDALQALRRCVIMPLSVAFLIKLIVVTPVEEKIQDIWEDNGSSHKI